jgi:hypothetical protein
MRTKIETCDFVEEAEGIFSLQLFTRAACRSEIKSTSIAGGWEAAAIYKDEPDGSFGSDVRPEYRSASAFSLSRRSPIKCEFDRKVNRLIKPLINRVWQMNLRRHGATHLVRYTSGDFFTTHSDDVFEPVYRYFTVLCYLNDSFEGGETVFPLLDHAVKPRAGKAIIFPSSYLHCADPVKAGEKYIIVSWVTGPPPIRWI